MPLGLAHLNSTSRSSSTMVPRQGAGRAFRRVGVDEGQGLLSCSDDLGASFPACHRWQRARRGNVFLPTSLHSRQVAKPALQCSHPWDHLAHVPAIRLSSTVLLRLDAGPSPEYCSWKGARPALMTPRQGLPPTVGGEGWGRGRVSLPHLCHLHWR